jgi:ceramide glucosyltransferase
MGENVAWFWLEALVRGRGPEHLLGLILGLAAISYLLLALWRVWRYRVAPAGRAPAALPPVTVLKPICGGEPGLYRCLKSFCTQDYPQLQLVFGVREADDPAIAVVERLIDEFPELDIALVVDRRQHGTNLKISNLINMYPAAKHDVIVVSDSDTLVSRDCLIRVVAPFADPATGAVTCLYKAAPLGNLASRLGALFINDWFLSSAIVDAGMREVAYCFGPVTAVRRAALEAAGGFGRLAFHLADDFLLGRRIAAAGYRVRLSDHVVDTIVAESFGSLFQHELRWARTVRTLKPSEHFLSVVTQPLPLLLLLLLPRLSPLGGAILGTAIGLRLMLHVLLAARFRSGEPLSLALVPVRECLCFVVWMASFFGNDIRWRQRRFAIGHGDLLADFAHLGLNLLAVGIVVVQAARQFGGARGIAGEKHAPADVLAGEVETPRLAAKRAPEAA